MLRALFIGLSTSRALRSFAETSTMGQKMSRRFVAGTTVEELMNATQEVNRRGMSVSVDNLGENVTNTEEARHSEKLYHQLLDLSVTLTTTEGQQGALETKAAEAGARVRVEDDDF